MCNRCKRRPLLILLFFTHIILFSTYTFIHYQSNASYDDLKNNSLTIILAPDRLPANLIEKTDRSHLNKNYRNSKIQQKTDPSPTKEKLESLNVSYVADIDQQETIVQCSILPTNLVGRVEADLFSYEMEEVEKHHENSSVQVGGHWSPSHCTSRYRVAIIIPYRNRDMQLRIFLNFMHPFLQKQQIDYQIFLIEPVDDVTFNRALLFNIGFNEAMKHYAWECFIFHDVDLIPEDDRNIYSCPPEPRHMSVAVNTLNYELPYRTIFGGVSALTIEQFKSVNGFSNQYFGWGGEDDDMAARILTKYRISRYPASIARYKMLRHQPDTPNQSRYKILGLSIAMRSVDGLSNLQYTMIETHKNKLFTLIRVTYNETLIKSAVAHIKKKNMKMIRHKTQ
ncbi:unnamed protein product [Rotaria magnacalcarata]|uniref:Beta-1,4-galactosyltransferase n=1 Tax=Rotaria magnacalcarata TaxID=392030 RepID=A0A819E0U7_9BILA|nr:unnamed protein product [Rotaria magnacalcarata]CAF3764887.1 unnamed protein product [Rotaria magnacalcarata]CAF3786846.1 unnamed protein product [Rotaria magnacalcarata]CAF3839224.1 unnamed protein product [Rotaria magnacalcarata]CAF3842754.1 unnamed protein product [Rotaria magnacalcarata]